MIDLIHFDKHVSQPMLMELRHAGGKQSLRLDRSMVLPYKVNLAIRHWEREVGGCFEGTASRSELLGKTRKDESNTEKWRKPMATVHLDLS